MLEDIKKERFAQLKAENIPNTTAYSLIKPNVKKSTACVEGSKLAKDVEVRQRVKEILNQKKALSLDTVIKSVGKDLKATKDVYYKGSKIGEEDNTPAKIHAQDTLLKLHGALKETTIEDKSQHNHIHLNSKDLELLETVIKDSDECLQSGEVIDITPTDAEGYGQSESGVGGVG